MELDLTNCGGELTVTDTQHVANLFSNHFSFVFNIICCLTITTNTSSYNIININLKYELCNFVITTKEVLKTLRPLFKTNKSPGPDKIYHILLKETMSEILSSLTTIFNTSLHTVQYTCIDDDEKS